jgi:hypothetical protein
MLIGISSPYAPLGVLMAGSFYVEIFFNENDFVSIKLLDPLIELPT